MEKEKIKKLVKSNLFLYKACKALLHFYYSHGGLDIKNSGVLQATHYVKGKNNQVIVCKGGVIEKADFHIVGNNNKITFGKNVRISKGCSFQLDGDNIEITIGENTSFVYTNHLCAQENGTRIIIGDNCMLSNNIIIRTSDSHPIFNQTTGERINHAKDVIIGNNVWIAAHATIMKGVHIGDGSIVGFGSVVTKDVAENTLVAGIPAREVKKNVCWRFLFNEKI